MEEEVEEEEEEEGIIEEILKMMMILIIIGDQEQGRKEIISMRGQGEEGEREGEEGEEILIGKGIMIGKGRIGQEIIEEHAEAEIESFFNYLTLI